MRFITILHFDIFVIVNLHYLFTIVYDLIMTYRKHFISIMLNIMVVNSTYRIS